VADLRAIAITPHVAQEMYSAIDARTTRHPSYAVSQRKPKLVEQMFGWMKTVGGLRKLRHRAGALVNWMTSAAADYNLIRLLALQAPHDVHRALDPGHAVEHGPRDGPHHTGDEVSRISNGAASTTAHGFSAAY